jgi:uncharacterized protein YgiM (DUF1202 family)
MFPAQKTSLVNGSSSVSWPFQGLGIFLFIAALMAMAPACALMQPRPLPETYYVIPSVTYIRESPGYASRNTATIYQGGKVLVLSRLTGGDWCRVQSVRGGEVGFIQCALLSPVPKPQEIYTVRENEVPLRDVPQIEGTSRQALQRGDKVRKLSENQQGWWQVLVEKNEALGWLPGTTVTRQAPETAAAGQTGGPKESAAAGGKASPPPAAPLNLYVATATLDLRLLPMDKSQIVKSLKFNDRVESIAKSGKDWLKVRFPETGAQGWTRVVLLTEAPAAAPKVFPPVKKRPLKKFRRPRPAGPETPMEEVEPEVM